MIRYKKTPKKMITVAAVMVLLCGCGISSTPEKKATESAVQTKSDHLVYGEEAVLEEYQDTPGIGAEERKKIICIILVLIAMRLRDGYTKEQTEDIFFRTI